MTDRTSLKDAIECGDAAAVKEILSGNPELANTRIQWVLNQENESDPLHYVSDCVFNKVLTNGSEGEIARLLLQHGADKDGSDGAESPLIGAASLSDVEGDSALKRSRASRSAAMTELLLRYGAGQFG